MGLTNKAARQAESIDQTTSAIPFTTSKEGIAVIELYGPIAFSDTSNVIFPNGADLILKQIKLAEDDKHIKAHEE